MKPIYFPFTYIPEHTAKAVHFFLKQFSVYLPSEQNIPESMKNLESNKIINLLIPFKGDAPKIDSALKEFKSWGDFHNTEKFTFLKTMTDQVPFFNDTSISQIREDIKKVPGSNNKKKDTSLFAARVFLHFAQELDIQHFEISSNLNSCAQKEKSLFKDLKAIDEDDHIFTNRSPMQEDQGNYMTNERILAWGQLFMHSPENSALFITTSKSVLEKLIEKENQAAKILSSGLIPDNMYDEFNKCLKKAAESTWDPQKNILEKQFGTAEQKISSRSLLTLYIIPDKGPGELFTGSVKIKDTRFKNTLIGFIQNEI